MHLLADFSHLQAGITTVAVAVIALVLLIRLLVGSRLP